MNNPDAYLLVVCIGLFVVICSDLGTWVCGCFDARITQIAYGPFQSDPPTRMYRAYTTSKLIMYFSSAIMYTIIYTAINPTDWSWMTILHACYFFFHFLWVPMVYFSIRRKIKWVAVVVVWMSTFTMLGILILLWIDDSHPKITETDIRVASSAATLIFYHHLFWDSYIWSSYYDPQWCGDQTMPCTMPSMSSVELKQVTV